MSVEQPGTKLSSCSNARRRESRVQFEPAVERNKEKGKVVTVCWV